MEIGWHNGKLGFGRLGEASFSPNRLGSICWLQVFMSVVGGWRGLWGVVGLFSCSHPEWPVHYKQSPRLCCIKFSSKAFLFGDIWGWGLENE